MGRKHPETTDSGPLGMYYNLNVLYCMMEYVNGSIRSGTVANSQKQNAEIQV
jgi:hypothetical protein